MLISKLFEQQAKVSSVIFVFKLFITFGKDEWKNDLENYIKQLLLKKFANKFTNKKADKQYNKVITLK
jgi:hypothetical protein